MNSLFKIIVSITSKIFTAEVPKSLAQKTLNLTINLRSTDEQENKQTTNTTKTKKKPNKLYKR